MRYEVVEDIYVYRGYLEVSSATVQNVGAYFCAFNESIEGNPDYEYQELIIDHKATKFYIFVNGEIEDFLTTFVQ